MTRTIQILRGTNAQNNAFTGAAGELTMDTTNKELRIHDGETQGGKVVSVPTGTVVPFAGATAPDGFLICDGSAISRTRYADLFAVIGTTYGAGDGNSTFNLPNKTPTRQVIEFQEATAQNDYSWYRLYDDGWVEQGGIHSANNGTINLLIEMANNNYAVIRFNKNTSIQSYYPSWVVGYNDRYTTYFTFGYVVPPNVWEVRGMSDRGATQQNILCIKY